MPLASLGNLHEVNDRSPGRGPRSFVQPGGGGPDYLTQRADWSPVDLQNSLGKLLRGRAPFQMDIGVFVAGIGPRMSFKRVERPPSFPVDTPTPSVLQRGTPSALLGEQTVVYLAAVRSLLDEDKIGEARHVLEAAPLELLSQPVMRRLKGLLLPPRITISDRRDSDRTREYKWLRENRQAHRGEWVALEGEHVLASARSLKELRERLSDLGPARPPLIHHLQ